MISRIRASLLIVVIASTCLGSCDRESSSEAGLSPDGRHVVLRRGNGGDPQTLDPALADDAHALTVLADLYEGLVAIDADANVIPGVAESWEISEDGLTYTFRLRSDARWSNGELVRAVNFLAGLRRALDPATSAPFAFLLAPIKNAESIIQGTLPPSALGVATPDDRTLIIQLQLPAPQLLPVLAMPIAYPLDGEDEADLTQFSDPEKFVGNGPFILDDWRPGGAVRLRKNLEFRDSDVINIDFVEYYPITEPLTELNMFRARELDITATVPGSHVAALRESHPDELRIAPSLAIYYIAFDLSEAPFDNPELRQALSMAVDRDALVEVIGRGEQPAHGLVPDGVRDYRPARFDWAALDNEERSVRALKLYHQADYSESKPLRLTLMYDAGDIHETVALAVSSMWQSELGAVVELDKREWKYFLATRENREDWQAMRFAWTGDFNHPSTFTGILHSQSPQNLPGYQSERYDALIAAAQASPDPEVQSRLLAEAESVMLSDNPIAPLYFYVSKHLVSKSVTGFRSNALDQHPSRYISVNRERFAQ